jgi:hypothetical protein
VPVPEPAVKTALVTAAKVAEAGEKVPSGLPSNATVIGLTG